MKTRYLTLLLSLTFLGFSVTTYAGPPGQCTPWPGCKNSAGSNNDELYNVAIEGVVSGSGHLWLYDGKGVDYDGWLQSSGDGVLDLSFFRHSSGPFPARGLKCFTIGNVPLYAAGILKHRRSSARGAFWFEGFTDDGVTPVLYLLVVTGTFDNPKTWPEENGNLMHLTNWEIKVENEGSVTSGASCEDEGADPQFMLVDAFPSP